MPHYAAVPRFHVARLPFATKVLATLYLATVLGALALAVRYYAAKTDFTRAAIARHYQGEDPEAAPGDGGGPLVIHERKSDLELIQALHPHAFSVPIVLFIVCHFYALTSRSEGTKVAAYLASFGSTAALFLSPWLVRGTTWGVPVLAGSALVLIGTVVGMIGVTTFEMWSRPPASPFEGLPVGHTEASSP